MQLLINDEPVDVTFENEQNAGEAALGIERWLNARSHVIEHIVINEGEGVYFAGDERLQSVPLKDVKTFNVRSRSFVETAFATYAETYRYLERALASNLDDPLSDLRLIADGVTWVTSALPEIAPFLSIDVTTPPIRECIAALAIKSARLTALVETNAAEAKTFYSGEMQREMKTLLTLLEKEAPAAELAMLSVIGEAITKGNALFRVNALASLIEPLTTLIMKTVEALQTGNDKEAFFGIQKFTEGAQKMFSVLATIRALFDFDYTALLVNGVSFEAHIRETEKALSDVIDAMENEDYVTIADILEYEVNGRITAIAEYLRELYEALRAIRAK